MLLKKWQDLPDKMRCEEVRPYYDALVKHRGELVVKRLFDIIVSLTMLVVLAPVFLILAIAIALDSSGGVFFRQVRVTTYGKNFRIFKFRTMVANAERIGAQVTTGNDMRVTKIGRFLRKCRLDELPQLINILLGDMTFVGTRPEVVRYVEQYTPEMLATLLLPAGVTSEASIQYKDESRLLDAAEDVDKVYVEQVLPGKMEYNLMAIKKFSLRYEFGLLFRTILAVIK